MGCSSSDTSTREETEVGHKDFLDDYILGKRLGRGAFAQVRVATKVSRKKKDPDNANVERAVKILQLTPKDKPEEKHRKLQQQAQKELNIWATVGSHPNCVRLVDMYFAEEFCFMVMEKCGSSLFAALEGMPELNEQSLGNVFNQMLVGISHCHSVGVIHRDIKPDNFLVGGQDLKTVKLCDFGLSALMKKEGKLQGVYGTAPFMSPEMLQGFGYDEKTDVWSFAAIVYVMLFGRFPYMPKRQNASEMKQAIVNASPAPSYKPTTPPNEPHVPRISQLAVSFASRLLNRESEGRPTAQEALTLPWMDSIRQDCLWNGKALDSLRPMMYAAKKIGAFEMRDTAADTSVDAVLNELVMARRGTPLPPTESQYPKVQKDQPLSVAKVKSSSSAKDGWDAVNGSSSTTACGSSKGSRLDPLHESDSDSNSLQGVRQI